MQNEQIKPIEKFREIELYDHIVRFNHKFRVVTIYYFQNNLLNYIYLCIYKKINNKYNLITLSYIPNEDARIDYLCNFFNLDKKNFYKFFTKMEE